jgi:hypothetical protein
MRAAGDPGVVRAVVAALALLLLLGAGASCSGYGAGFVLRGATPASNGAPSADLETAARVADAMADAHRMRRRLDFRSDAPILLPDESQLLLEFVLAPLSGHAGDGDGERSRLLLGVSSSRDGSEIRFVLQDLDQARESERFAKLRGDLAQRLAQAYPGRTLALESGPVGREGR